MLLTLIGPGTLIAPAPAGPKIAPSPAALFQAAPDQLRLVVSQRELLEPLSQLTSAARRDVALEVTASAASATFRHVRRRDARVAPEVRWSSLGRACMQSSSN